MIPFAAAQLLAPASLGLVPGAGDPGRGPLPLQAPPASGAGQHAPLLQVPGRDLSGVGLAPPAEEVGQLPPHGGGDRGRGPGPDPPGRGAQERRAPGSRPPRGRLRQHERCGRRGRIAPRAGQGLGARSPGGPSSRRGGNGRALRPPPRDPAPLQLRPPRRRAGPRGDPGPTPGRGPGGRPPPGRSPGGPRGPSRDLAPDRPTSGARRRRPPRRADRAHRELQRGRSRDSRRDPLRLGAGQLRDRLPAQADGGRP